MIFYLRIVNSKTLFYGGITLKDAQEKQFSEIILLPELKLECHFDLMIETRKYRIIESISDMEFLQNSNFNETIKKDFEILKKMFSKTMPKENVTSCLTVLKFAESLNRKISFASISNDIL